MSEHPAVGRAIPFHLILRSRDSLVCLRLRYRSHWLPPLKDISGILHDSLGGRQPVRQQRSLAYQFSNPRLLYSLPRPTRKSPRRSSFPDWPRPACPPAVSYTHLTLPTKRIV